MENTNRHKEIHQEGSEGISSEAQTRIEKKMRGSDAGGISPSPESLKILLNKMPVISPAVTSGIFSRYTIVKDSWKAAVPIAIAPFSP